MNKYICFAIAVLTLFVTPSLFLGDSKSASSDELPTWSVDIRILENGIQVMCLEGCAYKTASIACIVGDRGCIVGLGESGVGGGSGRPFEVGDSDVLQPDA